MPARYAVIGATGATGGAVTAALKHRGSQVRAITRNLHSARAQHLSQTGVEVLAADLHDVEALAHAFTGVTGVFAVTTPFEDGPDAEREQGLNLVTAAEKAQVPHLVFSSVGGADQHTGIPHFESKAAIEATLTDSGVPYTIVGPTYFYDNLLGGLDELRAGRFTLPIPPNTPLQQLSRNDFGRFVATVLHDPLRFIGARIDVASDAPTPSQMVMALHRTLGHPIDLATPDPAQIDSPDMRAMFTYLSEHGYSADIVGLRQTYPEVGWQRFEDWLDETVQG
ncbi:MAG: NmrA/HSCARG family protein [Mycobacterium sp.]